MLEPIAIAYPIGICCSGKRCIAPTHWLRPEHKCPKCGGLVHIQCGVFDMQTDKYVCLPCNDGDSSPPQVPQPQLAPPQLQETARPSTTLSTAKKCPTCGGTDHQRRTSRKCKFYKPKNSSPPITCTAASTSPPPTEEATNNEIVNNTTIAAGTSPAVTEEATNNKIVNNTITISNLTHALDTNATGATLNDSTNNTSLNATDDGDEEEELLISKTNFINVTNSDLHSKPVVDVESNHFKPLQTTFKTIIKNHRGRQTTTEPTASALMEKYWDKKLILYLCKALNKYRETRKEAEPNAWVWEKQTYSREITPSCIFHLLALLYYFGICRLPSKEDYWANDEYMPKHQLAHELSMTKGRFQFLWRHFHIYVPNENFDDDDAVDGDGDEDDDVLVEQQFERVQREQMEAETEEETNDDDDTNTGISSEDTQQNQEQTIWFSKLKPLIDHVRDVSFSLVHILGTFLSLDEMMIRFMGRFRETHRIKTKQLRRDTNSLSCQQQKGLWLISHLMVERL